MCIQPEKILPVADELMNARVIHCCIGFDQLPDRTFNTLIKWCIYFANSTKLISVWMCVTLNNIIQKTFPEEYAERKAKNDSLINVGADLLPLFVMGVILPCEKLTL